MRIGAFVLVVVAGPAVASYFGAEPVLDLVVGREDRGERGGQAQLELVSVDVVRAGTRAATETIEAVGTSQALQSVEIRSDENGRIAAISFETGDGRCPHRTATSPSKPPFRWSVQPNCSPRRRWRRHRTSSPRSAARQGSATLTSISGSRRASCGRHSEPPCDRLRRTQLLRYSLRIHALRGAPCYTISSVAFPDRRWRRAKRSTGPSRPNPTLPNDPARQQAASRKSVNATQSFSGGPRARALKPEAGRQP